mmetsp:Transcript_6469/g.20967  ORF Transcript_6469/g.20967 Transcript_6469/m.20967 type:complete len:398 (+) Transcript_6469:406-1599(+)
MFGKEQRDGSVEEACARQGRTRHGRLAATWLGLLGREPLDSQRAGHTAMPRSLVLKPVRNFARNVDEGGRPQLGLALQRSPKRLVRRDGLHHVAVDERTVILPSHNVVDPATACVTDDANQRGQRRRLHVADALGGQFGAQGAAKLAPQPRNLLQLHRCEEVHRSRRENGHLGVRLAHACAHFGQHRVDGDARGHDVVELSNEVGTHPFGPRGTGSKGLRHGERGRLLARKDVAEAQPGPCLVGRLAGQHGDERFGKASGTNERRPVDVRLVNGRTLQRHKAIALCFPRTIVGRYGKARHLGYKCVERDFHLPQNPFRLEAVRFQRNLASNSVGLKDANIGTTASNLVPTPPSLDAKGTGGVIHGDNEIPLLYHRGYAQCHLVSICLYLAIVTVKVK